MNNFKKIDIKSLSAKKIDIDKIRRIVTSKKFILTASCIVLFMGILVSVLTIFPKKDEIPTFIKNYEGIKEHIEDVGYTINRDDTNVRETINLNSDNNNFSFYINTEDERKLDYIAFEKTEYPDVFVAYDMNIMVGTSEDAKTCVYQLFSSTSDNEFIQPKKECTDEEIKHIKITFKEYNDTIEKTFGLTKEELYDFIFEHNIKTRPVKETN